MGLVSGGPPGSTDPRLSHQSLPVSNLSQQGNLTGTLAWYPVVARLLQPLEEEVCILGSNIKTGTTHNLVLKY
ncbi:hypothetical protein M0804_011911 [Polistes exclamans]|nr:hypothetical protein M0804_011911 [Polistes exclamans]